MKRRETWDMKLARWVCSWDWNAIGIISFTFLMGLLTGIFLMMINNHHQIIAMMKQL